MDLKGTIRKFLQMGFQGSVQGDCAETDCSGVARATDSMTVARIPARRRPLIAGFT